VNTIRKAALGGVTYLGVFVSSIVVGLPLDPVANHKAYRGQG